MAAVRLVVLHTAEGARTYLELGNFFANPASGVSSHVGIDDTFGTVGEYVQRPWKAWTQANANPYSVSAELCAFAEWDAAEWSRHPNMLANTAQWVAEECRYFGIPVRALTPSQAQGGYAGVCQHVDLGALGGGHWDCGPAFPMAAVISMAGGAGLEVVPPTPEDHMFIRQTDDQMHWFIADGADSYWRPVPEGLRQNVPEDWVMDDPNGDWLALWPVGAPR